MLPVYVRPLCSCLCRLHSLPFPTRMPRPQLDIDVFVGNRTRAMPRIIPHMLSWPMFHILRDTRVPEPMHGRFRERLRFVLTAIGFKPCFCPIKTVLNDHPNLAGWSNRPFPKPFGNQGMLISWRRQGGEGQEAAVTAQCRQHRVAHRDLPFLVAFPDGDEPPQA